jgi:L-2-hydroxyglutarate oxidase LhgO
MDRVSTIVIGAGAIGLAIARAVSAAGREVVVLERNESFGMETSARSNEVIHASIFHPPGGPQAILCRRGRDLTYAYCAARGIGHRQTGKLVLANTEADRSTLEEFFRRGRANGVNDLVWLESNDVRKLEPAIRCHAALSSPSSGIMDTHNLMLAYLGDVESAGGAIAFNSEVVAIRAEDNGFQLTVRDSTNQSLSEIACDYLVNAAGIWAPRIARMIEALPSGLVPKIYLAKGIFFKFQGRAPFSRLIVPSQPAWRSGGIFTLDLAGLGKFGPDEEWVDDVDYSIDEKRAAGVENAVRSYFPDLPAGKLVGDYAGIRPRLNGPGELPADWIFQGPREHGVQGLINLYGFESPGITSSLAIAEVVTGMMDGAANPFPLAAAKSVQQPAEQQRAS